MKYNLAEKKAWVTPSIQEAPVRVTEGGFFSSQIEIPFILNDKDKPASGS